MPYIHNEPLVDFTDTRYHPRSRDRYLRTWARRIRHDEGEIRVAAHRVNELLISSNLPAQTDWCAVAGWSGQAEAAKKRIAHSYKLIGAFAYGPINPRTTYSSYEQSCYEFSNGTFRE